MRDAMSLIAPHLQAVSNHVVKIHRMTGFWKIDSLGRPNFLYCTDMHSVRTNSDGDHVIKMSVRLKESDLGLRMNSRSNTLEVLKDGYKLRQLAFLLGNGASTQESLIKSIGVDAYRHFARRPPKSADNMRTKDEMHCPNCRSLFPKRQLYATKLQYLIAQYTSSRQSQTTLHKVVREVRPLTMFVEEHVKLQPMVNLAPIVRDLYPKMKSEEYVEETKNPLFMEKKIFVCADCFESLTPFMGKAAGVRSAVLVQNKQTRKILGNTNHFSPNVVRLSGGDSSEDSSLYILQKNQKPLETTPERLIPLFERMAGQTQIVSQEKTRSFFQKLGRPRKEELQERSEPISNIISENSVGMHQELSAPDPKSYRLQRWRITPIQTESKSTIHALAYSIPESDDKNATNGNLVSDSRQPKEKTGMFEHRWGVQTQPARSTSGGKSRATQTATRATTAQQPMHSINVGVRLTPTTNGPRLRSVSAVGSGQHRTNDTALLRVEPTGSRGSRERRTQSARL